MAFSVVTLFFMLTHFLLSEARVHHCEPLSNATENFCHSLGYTMTVLPNHFDHRTQAEAILQMSQYLPLIKVDCSNETKIFVCSVYLPMCNTVTNKPIPPCRSLCKNVERGCRNILERFGYSWPDMLKCSKFAVNGNEICVSPRNTALNTTNTTEKPTTTATTKTTRVTTKKLRGNSKKCQKGKRSSVASRCCSYGKQLWKKSKGCSLQILPPKRLNISKIQKKCNRESAKSCLQTCCEYSQRKDEAKMKNKKKNMKGGKIPKRRRKYRKRKGMRKSVVKRRRRGKKGTQ